MYISCKLPAPEWSNNQGYRHNHPCNYQDRYRCLSSVVEVSPPTWIHLDWDGFLNLQTEDTYTGSPYKGVAMPMLMLKCKNCGEVFPGIYVPGGSNGRFKSNAAAADPPHTCSRGHRNEYAFVDYMDWSWIILRTKTLLVSFPASFRLDESTSLPIANNLPFWYLSS